WLRDSGPAFVKDEKGEISAVHFKFNAWAKYNNFKKDQKIPGFISKKFRLNKITAGYNGRHVVLEGGSIDYNGSGTLLTTEEWLMDMKGQKSDQGVTKKDYEELYKKYLVISNTSWLGRGIVGDHTHGHVYDLFRFLTRNPVVLSTVKTPANNNY